MSVRLSDCPTVRLSDCPTVRLSIVPIQVSDQQAALQWDTKKLGMETIMDDPIGPDLRSITESPER